MRPIAGSTGAGAEGPKQSVPNPRPTPPRTPTPATTSRPNPGAANPHQAFGVTPSPAYQSTVATTTGAAGTYQYPSWTALDQRTRNLYIDIAKAYNPNSEGKTWYEEQFLPEAYSILEETGIAPDPEYMAIRFARASDYDISEYYRTSPALSPDSILYDQPGGRPSESDSSGGGGYGYGGGGGGGGGGSVSLASPSQAQSMLTQFMQATIGRDPNANEVRKFVEVLQDYQRNNPTTVSVEGDNVVQSGGIDPSVVAQEFVEDLPDYTESQADKYYRVFMGALLGGGA